MSSHPVKRVSAALFGAALLLPARGLAVDTLGLVLGSLEGQGWRADGIELHLNLQASDEIGFRIRIAEIHVAELSDPLRDLEIRCPQGHLDGSRLSCEDGRLHLVHPLLEEPEMGLSFAWDNASDRFEVQLRELAAVGGKSLIVVRGDRRHWAVSLDGRGLQPARLKAVLRPMGLEPPPWVFQGGLNLKVQAAGSAASVETLAWNGTLTTIGFSGPDGNYLGEGLAGEWKGELDAGEGSWSGSSVLTLRGGEVLTPFFYLAAEPHPVTLSADIGYRPTQRRMELNNLQFQQGALDIDGQAELALADEAPLRDLGLHADPVSVDALYQRYLQPVLAEGVAAKLETAGELGLNLSYRVAGASRLAMDLRDIHLDGAQTPRPEQGDAPEPRPVRPFGLYGINGRLVWTDRTDPEISELRWDGGHILEVIHLGPASLQLRIDAQGLKLLQEAEIPVLDGGLLVSSFALARQGDAAERITFEGVLTPVSMQRISDALGWPPLSGMLSGVIPGVSFEGGVLKVEGNLLLRAFDGEVLVRNLRMEDPLGIWPVVTADLEVRNLDLEALTGAFAFGKITGRLEGEIKNLRLEDWAPVAFDARFATPESDRSAHRISQRAVDNISDLGGAGVSGALSRSFLRYFEEFGYKRLGIRCRLRQGVCEMGGVAPAGDGYYLVEGGGIPRIDIVGFTRRTDWTLLVAQLKEIAAGSAGTPVIE